MPIVLVSGSIATFPLNQINVQLYATEALIIIFEGVSIIRHEMFFHI